MQGRFPFLGISVSLLLLGQTILASGMHQSFEFEAEICAESIARSGVSPQEWRSRVAESIKRVVTGVTKACHEASSCSTEDFHKALLGAIASQGKQHPTILRRLLHLPRRLLVLALYTTSVVGPGMLTYYLTEGFDEGPRIVLGNTVAGLSAFFLGRSGDALEKMFGPKLQQMTLIVWDPKDADAWGQIQRTLNENELLVNTHISSQLVLLQEHFATAGEAVRKGNVSVAADHYTAAILHSHQLFGGLHYYHPATVFEVRSWLPHLEGVSEAVKINIIVEVCRRIAGLRPDEIREETKPELLRFAFGVMLCWLVGVPEKNPADPRPPVAMKVAVP